MQCVSSSELSDDGTGAVRRSNTKWIIGSDPSQYPCRLHRGLQWHC